MHAIPRITYSNEIYNVFDHEVGVICLTLNDHLKNPPLYLFPKDGDLNLKSD